MVTTSVMNLLLLVCATSVSATMYAVENDNRKYYDIIGSLKTPTITACIMACSQTQLCDLVSLGKDDLCHLLAKKIDNSDDENVKRITDYETKDIMDDTDNVTMLKTFTEVNPF